MHEIEFYPVELPERVEEAFIVLTEHEEYWNFVIISGFHVDYLS